MGRPRKSDAQHARTGAAKRGKPKPPPLPKAQAKPSAHEPPAWLATEGGPHALMIWREVIAPRIDLNAIRENEHAIAARYCVHFARWLAAHRSLREKGEEIETPMTGGVGVMLRANPAQKRLAAAESALVALESQFGLTPMARYMLRNRANLHPGSGAGLFDQPPASSVEPPKPQTEQLAPPPAAPPSSAIGLLMKH